MDHQRAKELFSQYLEGDLPPEQRSEIEAHLDQCQTCKVEMDALEKTLNSLAGLAAVPPPKDFDRKVQQRIRRRSRGRFFTPENLLNRIPFEWISFVVIILMLVMYFMLIQAQVTVKPQVPRGDAGAAPHPGAVLRPDRGAR